MKTPRKELNALAKRRAKTPALLTLPKLSTPSNKDWGKLSPLKIEGAKGLRGLGELTVPKKPRR